MLNKNVKQWYVINYILSNVCIKNLRPTQILIPKNKGTSFDLYQNTVKCIKLPIHNARCATHKMKYNFTDIIYNIVYVRICEYIL